MSTGWRHSKGVPLASTLFFWANAFGEESKAAESSKRTSMEILFRAIIFSSPWGKFVCA